MGIPAFFLAILAMSLLGQSQSRPAGAAFEVASVKTNTSNSAEASWAGRGSQLMIQNYRLRDIIQGAYGLRPYQLAGGPAWIDTARFDIAGRAPDGVPRDISMLRTLLTRQVTVADAH